MMPKEQPVPSIGLCVPEILLPKMPGVAPEKWAVIACDQYSSEPEYWERVKSLVGDAPSALRLIYPECYLEEKDSQARIDGIHRDMRDCLSQGIIESAGPCFILTERRQKDNTARWGLVAALDLEAYDYSRDSRSLIRATEGTILDRIPPRKRIREEAPLELPHILVLLDDPQKTVIESLKEKTDRLTLVYDFDLMFDSGHLRGWKVDDPALIAQVIRALEDLKKKDSSANPLLYAMGDGNHSLATAKAVWEDKKADLLGDYPEYRGDYPEYRGDYPEYQSHPARFALVELENLHDPGIVFEAIHRVLFQVPEKTGELVADFTAKTGAAAEKFAGPEALKAGLEAAWNSRQPALGIFSADEFYLLTLPEENRSLPTALVQNWLDDYLKSRPASRLDYIHGEDSTLKLGSLPGNLGVLLPAISKDSFFEIIRRDGVCPRKTFSMGEAREKRFYMEARKICRD